MLGSVREFLNKSPWIGWALALVLLGASTFFFIRGRRNPDPYSPDNMKQMVTIRFTDTEDEMTIPLGRLDKELRQRGDHLDPTVGYINPKTNKPTGFLVAKKQWDEIIERINKEKEEAKKNPNSSAFSPAPPPAGKK
jgi:hypothetical protein